MTPEGITERCESQWTQGGGQGAVAQSLSINRKNRMRFRRRPASYNERELTAVNWVCDCQCDSAFSVDTEDGKTVMIRSVHYSKWVWRTVPRSPRFHLYYCSTKWQIHLDCSQTGCFPTSRNDHRAIHLTEKERKRMFVSASLCRRSILNNLHVSLAESFFISKHVLICSKYQLSSGCHIHVCDAFSSYLSITLALMHSLRDNSGGGSHPSF